MRDISKPIGSLLGYIDNEEWGYLKVTVCKRPGTVILFDEIENVHLAVIYKDPQEVPPILKWIQETPTLPVSGMTLSTDSANSTYRIDSINQSIVGEKLLDETVVQKSSKILVPWAREWPQVHEVSTCMIIFRCTTQEHMTLLNAVVFLFTIVKYLEEFLLAIATDAQNSI